MQRPILFIDLIYQGEAKLKSHLEGVESIKGFQYINGEQGRKKS